MKITRITPLIDVGGFSISEDYQHCKEEVMLAIKCIEYPHDSGGFYLYDKKQANGVKPIKDLFIKELDRVGWKNERIADEAIRSRKVDTSKLLTNGKYFCVEWETGNISSSHRALNRLALSIRDGIAEGGFLVLPSRKMYFYLTDRVGNYSELEIYFPIWQDLCYAYEIKKQNACIQIIEIEHDGARVDIKPIPKGTDGRALI